MIYSIQGVVFVGVFPACWGIYRAMFPANPASQDRRSRPTGQAPSGLDATRFDQLSGERG